MAAYMIAFGYLARHHDRKRFLFFVFFKPVGMTTGAYVYVCLSLFILNAGALLVDRAKLICRMHAP